MDYAEAATHLGSLLDVTEERYPTATRILHLQNAVSRLGKEFETSINEGMGQLLFPADSEYVSATISDSAGSGLVARAVTGIWAVKEFTRFSPFDVNTWTADEPWERVKIYPDLQELMDAQRKYSTGLYGFTQYGNRLYGMNAIDYDLLLRVSFHGAYNFKSQGVNEWIGREPFLVIYKAAQLSCVWLEDEGRIPVYQAMFDEEAQVVNLADSRRGDVPLESEEA